MLKKGVSEGKVRFCRTLYALSGFHCHPFNYSFIHTFIHSSIHPFIHSFIHPSIHSFIHSSIHPSIHSFNHSSIHLFSYQFIHLVKYQFIHLFSIHSFIRSTYPPVKIFANLPLRILFSVCAILQRNKQRNKQTNKQASKQTNKQTRQKQRNNTVLWLNSTLTKHFLINTYN